MGILAVLLAVSAALAAAGVWFFVWTVGQGSHEHADRLSLLPLAPDEPADTTSHESTS